MCHGQRNECTLQYHLQNSHRRHGNEVYAMRTGQLLADTMKEIRKLKATTLLNNFNHETTGRISLFSDAKNFDQDQRLNRRNNCWICRKPEDAPTIMHTKYPNFVMVLSVVVRVISYHHTSSRQDSG